MGVQCTLLYRKAQYLLVLNYREQFGLDAMVAEIKITKPVLCLALRKAPPNQAAMLNKPGMKLTAGKFGNRPRDFTYDVSKADEIYDCLDKVGSPEHQVQLDTLKGQNPVCKFHASNSHATADCVAFCHAIQDKIDGGLLKFPEKGKQMLIDKQPFPKTAQAAPVYIHDHYGVNPESEGEPTVTP